MDYFKKVGRPTDEEQAVINMIEGLIKEKQIPRSEIPHCNSLDDLLEVQNLVEAYVTTHEKSVELGEPETEVNMLNAETESGDSDVDNFTPYEGDGQPIDEHEADIQELQTEEDQTATIETIESDNDPTVGVEIDSDLIEEDTPNFVADDYDPFSDEIKERSYTGGLNTESKQKGTEGEAPPEPHLDEADETPVDNLNPNTKRKVAEQTANSLLKGYAKLAPQPFKWLAKINEQKIEKLAFEGEININLEVSEGTTFDDYMKQTNEQVDEIFEVDEDTLDEIREPLIEVLLEQKMELTPKQRLMMAVISHLFQMLTVAINLRRQNNRILEYQKRMTLLAAQKAA